MRTLIVIATLLLISGGCGIPSVPVAKQEAHQRWYSTRAAILQSVALEHYKSGQLDRARSKANEALALNPKCMGARTLLGKVYIEQGSYAQGISELTKAHEEHPESGEILYLLAVAQEKQGLLDDALINYRRSQAIDSADMAPVMAATEVLVFQNRIREAQLYVESYLPNAQDDPGMYELAARLAMMQNEYEKAAEYYQTACDLDYKNLRYSEALGKALFFAGDHKRAVEIFESLTDSSQYSPTAWVFAMLGDCYMAIARPNEARKVYYRASEMNPSDSGVWSNLAKAALMLEDLPGAINAARRAMSLDSGCLEAAVLVGYGLLRDGQISQSRSILTQAVKKHPDSPELQCVLGRTYSADGNQGEAMRYYTAALRLDPENALAKELLSTVGMTRLSGTER